MQILLGRRGHYLQGDGEIDALFSGIKGAQTPLGGLNGGESITESGQEHIVQEGLRDLP